MRDPEFAGLGALVTGGASGIGLATARLLAARGARVACLDLAPAPLEAPLEQVRADVGDDAAVRAAVGEAARRLGGLDIVVNNAGVGAVGTIEANSDHDWHQVFDVNVLGIVRVTRAALPCCGPRITRWWSTPARSRPASACPTGPCTAPPRAPCRH